MFWQIIFAYVFDIWDFITLFEIVLTIKNVYYEKIYLSWGNSQLDFNEF